MEKNEHVVDSANAGIRLDQYLAAMERRSRASVQKEIENGGVRVNGKERSSHQKLREGDRITHVATTVPVARKRERTTVTAPIILTETDDYLVIDKSSGVLVHPAEGRDEPSLIDWLREYVKGIDAVGELHRPGLVHRLDRDVSGVMVVATSVRGYDHLLAQFKNRLVKKFYTTLVIGAPVDEEGTLHFNIGRSRKKKRMAARPKNADGKEAVTKYTVLRRYRTTTLLSVRILTGRTHQIRASLFAAGWPVVGDTLYHQKKATVRLPDLGRPFLHASLLGFEDLEGRWKEFESGLPSLLQGYLEHLPS